MALKAESAPETRTLILPPQQKPREPQPVTLGNLALPASTAAVSLAVKGANLVILAIKASLIACFSGLYSSPG